MRITYINSRGRTDNATLTDRISATLSGYSIHGGAVERVADQVAATSTYLAELTTLLVKRNVIDIDDVRHLLNDETVTLVEE